MIFFFRQIPWTCNWWKHLKILLICQDTCLQDFHLSKFTSIYEYLEWLILLLASDWSFGNKDFFFFFAQKWISLTKLLKIVQHNLIYITEICTNGRKKMQEISDLKWKIMIDLKNTINLKIFSNKINHYNSRQIY